MTPKEQAIELVNNYTVLVDGLLTFKKVKQCAIIAVDEILLIFYEDMNELRLEEINYWTEVKYEIEKL